MAQRDQASVWIYFNRFVTVLIVVLLFGFFVIWRVDNPRAEAFRLRIIDALPDFSGVFKPFERVSNIVLKFQSYNDLQEENKNLRRQIGQLKNWREAASQLERINAELRALNNLKFSPRQNYITADIVADVGGNFAQSVLINVGRDKNVRVGDAALDGFGLMGRVIAVGEQNARVLLLNDTQSQISAMIMPDRIRAIVKGKNDLELELHLLESGKRIFAGSQVVTSGDGILPPDILIGTITIDSEGQGFVKIASDYEALEFARILIQDPAPQIDDVHVVVPVEPAQTEQETPQDE